MKKLIVLTLLTVLLAPISTYAEATSSIRGTVIDRVRSLKPELRENDDNDKNDKEEGEEIQSRIEERKQLRLDIKKKAWNERIGIARERIGTIRGHITRLETVANRILQVAAVREGQGVDVSEVRSLVTKATNSLAEAKTQLESIITQFPTEKNASTTPGATISTIAHSLTDVVTLIKSAHEDLRNAWETLKILKPVPVSTTGTTTSSL